MGRGRLAAAWEPLRAVFSEGTVAGLSDGELLARYVDRRDANGDSAFDALVARHGPMVLRVCRNLLRNRHDAEDAAQATFVVLARRAGSIRRVDSLASWLFGVASRVAKRSRAESARSRAVESRRATATESNEGASESWPELYEELASLPDRYRRPIVLFHLEGLSYEQAAQQLRCPVRTVQTRLARGRARLRERLVRRGVAIPAVLFATVAAREGLASIVPIVRGGKVPVHVLTLADGVIRTMTLSKLKIVVTTAFALCVSLTAGFGLPGASATGPTPSTLAPPPLEQRELKADDGKSAGKSSIAGDGHAVKFEAPGDGWKVTSVRLFGSRYGYPQPPEEDFRVFLCDADFKKLATFNFPYAKFERGDARWVTLDVKPTAVPKTFFVCVDFDPAQTKGVYVHRDAEGTGTSFVGLPGGDKPKPFTRGDWMLRATIVGPGDKDAPKR